MELVSWRSAVLADPPDPADPGGPFSPLGVAAEPVLSELAVGGGPVGVATDPAGVDAPTPPFTPPKVP